MMKLRTAPLLCLLGWLVLPLVSAAAVHASGGQAAGGLTAPTSVAAVTARDEVSLSEAVASVKRQYGGRILEAETREQNGNRVHVIKVLTDKGRVRTVRIPAGGDGRRER